MDFDRDAVRRHYAQLAPRYGQRANAACERTYRRLLREHLSGARRVLEIGCGAGQLLAHAPATFRAGCDMTWDMLRQSEGAGENLAKVCADAGRLPFDDASFDAALSVNVIEHVPEPPALIAEAARILQPGGRLLLITPNGSMAGMLELLENLRLKLPEGPHRFVRPPELKAWAVPHFEMLRHECLLLAPIGPEWLVRAIDRWMPGARRMGLFQFACLRRKR